MNDHSAKEPTKRGTMDYGHDWRGLDDLSGSERTKSLNSWYYPTLAREEFAFRLFTAVSSLLAGWAEVWLFFMWRRRDTPSSDTLTWLWLHFCFSYFI
jgi:hypothetical protein